MKSNLGVKYIQAVSGSVKSFTQIGSQVQGRMKSVSIGDIRNGSFQVHHIHILLVSLLGTAHMAQPVADQHKGGTALRKGSHYTGTTVDPPVYALFNLRSLLYLIYFTLSNNEKLLRKSS